MNKWATRDVLNQKKIELVAAVNVLRKCLWNKCGDEYKNERLREF